ncbi:MAG: ABC transporter substrate-binding protein, partial [Nitrososphaerales archaeon]
YGVLPLTDVTSSARAPSKPTETVRAGANSPRVAATYELVPAYRWGIDYVPYNFDSTGDTGNAGPIFDQLYFRQAMQLLVDQPLYIDRLIKGYGVPTYGPVPVWPENPFASRFEEKDPYAYNPAKAKALLESHGWKVVPGGVSACVRPGTGSGDCGRGIKPGAKLSFTMQYASGTKNLTHLMDAEKGSWSAVGIRMGLSSATFNTVNAVAVPCPKGCSWELENWGGGWIYSPDYYPTGEEIFAKGAASNSGNFTTPTDDKLIAETDTTKLSLTKYENLLAKNLPVLWQPEDVTVVEIHKGLEGVTPLNPIGAVTPAYWHWTK